MIRVFNIPAITWTLTAFLLLSGSYQVLQATKSKQRTDRVNKSLHALMNVLMAVTLWNLAPSFMLAQVAVLAGAALWFVIQAVARPEFKTLCAGSQRRLTCVYHSITMAGAALMVSMMGQVTTTTHEMQAGGTSTPHAHHATPAETKSLPAATFDHSPDLALLLTIVFGVAAVVFTVLLLRFRVPTITPPNKSVPRLSVRAEHGLEALGAAAMALMFAAMST